MLGITYMKKKLSHIYTYIYKLCVELHAATNNVSFTFLIC